MGVRAFLVLGVVLVSLMVISSEVAARELAENHEAETKLIEGLQLTLQMGVEKIIAEGDSQLVVKLITKQCKPGWKLSILSDNARYLLKKGGLEEGKYGGGGYGHGGGGYGGGGHGGGGYGGGGGHCQRCCRYGSCHCCTEAEIAAQQAEAKPHN